MTLFNWLRTWIIGEKKAHFKNKVLLTKQKMWDLEFVSLQLRSMREGYRKEYDNMQEQIDAANLRLADEKKKEDPDKTIIENLDNLLARYLPDIEQLKKNMDSIDIQLEGADSAEGHQQGMNDTIEGHRANLNLLSDYMKVI